MSKAKQGIGGGDCGHPLSDAVEPGITKDSNPIASHSQTREAIRIFFRDGCRRGYSPIAGFQKPPSRPPEPAAARTYGGRHDSNLDTRGGRSGCKFRPDVELDEHEEIGLQGAKQTIYVRREIVG